MTFQRSDQQQGGRYVQGGTVDLVGNRLGWWERKVFPKAASDVTYQVTRKYVGRPDLLAYDLYGRANLQWFILQYNTLSDLNEDFVEGKLISLPTRSRLFGELLSRSNR